MAVTEATPCALCLAVDESTSMLQVQLPPQKGVPGMQRHLCAGCVSAIDAAMSESERFANPAKLLKRKARGGRSHADSEPAAAELASGSTASSTIETGDQEAKVAEAHD
jgi:hypothetical protein